MYTNLISIWHLAAFQNFAWSCIICPSELFRNDDGTHSVYLKCCRGNRSVVKIQRAWEIPHVPSRVGSAPPLRKLPVRKLPAAREHNGQNITVYYVIVQQNKSQINGRVPKDRLAPSEGNLRRGPSRSIFSEGFSEISRNH